jgi:integrase
MQYLNRAELGRLLKVAYDSNKLHHAALCAGLWHGLRSSEIGQIEGTDVSDGKLYIKRLKKSKATIQELHRDNNPIFDEGYLLQLAKENPTGKLLPLCRQRLDELMKKYGKEAGLHRSLRHFHCLKHSIAMLILDATHSPGAIQQWLGHKSMSSTLQYLQENDSRTAQEAVHNINLSTAAVAA